MFRLYSLWITTIIMLALRIFLVAAVIFERAGLFNVQYASIAIITEKDSDADSSEVYIQLGIA